MEAAAGKNPVSHVGKVYNQFSHEIAATIFKELDGVEEAYVEILQRLYREQTATVAAGTDSRPFPSMRGVKQGDPISGLLFICVMEICFRELTKWAQLNRKRAGPYFGIVIDDEKDVLSNLRFADDVLLVASRLSDVKKMITHLTDSAAKY